jgi:hypothetical protein
MLIVIILSSSSSSSSSGGRRGRVACSDDGVGRVGCDSTEVVLVPGDLQVAALTPSGPPTATDKMFLTSQYWSIPMSVPYPTSLFRSFCENQGCSLTYLSSVDIICRSASKQFFLDAPSARDLQIKTKRYDQRAFKFVALTSWNSLPGNIREKSQLLLLKQP